MALKNQVATGEIDQNTFEASLIELVDFAPDGYYWMFGHETEQWYQHDGTQWVPKDPGKLRMLTPKDGNPLNPLPHNPHTHPNNAASLTEPTLTELWRSVEWGWLIASLVTLGVIGWVVYASV